LKLKREQRKNLMAKFIIIYHGSGNMQSMSPEEGMAHRKKWMAWVEGLGDAVVTPGQPVKGNQMLSTDGASDAEGDNRISGYAVIEAADMGAAMEMAKGDPFMAMGGSIQVAEMVSMGG
jgi:hypothetical protein